MTSEYEIFKLNAIVLSNKLINVISHHSQMVIELDQSPSTGYCWYYTLSDPSILTLEDKKEFNFNKPNIIGGRNEVIWKFKPIRCGECKIHFTYYKSWDKEHSSIDEYMYIIKVE